MRIDHLLVAHLVLAVIGALLAKAHGYKRVTGFLVGLFFGVLGVAFLVLARTWWVRTFITWWVRWFTTWWASWLSVTSRRTQPPALTCPTGYEGCDVRSRALYGTYGK